MCIRDRFRDEAIETGEKDCGFGVCYCSYPNVFRDPAAKLYRCYYTVLLETGERHNKDNEEGHKLITALAYAQSPDGLEWERPALGITEFKGSCKNNLLRLYAHGSSVIYDELEKDPCRRYKLVTRDDREPRHICSAFSEDGLHFGEYKCCLLYTSQSEKHICFWIKIALRGCLPLSLIHI